MRTDRRRLRNGGTPTTGMQVTPMLHRGTPVRSSMEVTAVLTPVTGVRDQRAASINRGHRAGGGGKHRKESDGTPQNLRLLQVNLRFLQVRR